MTAQINLFQNFFIEALKNAKLEGRDFFDVLIIAFLVYVAIKLLRETHSISVFAGVLTLLGFYGAAQLFDLPLTSLILRSFFGIFFIIIAIIFQRELRRFFSAFGLFGVAHRFMPPSEMTIEIVSRSVGRMSDEKIGALIIFPGKEQIDRHLEGGYRLNGEISEPLLMSIFDKTSPGHDGATIIDNNRIRKFAVHLPLAEQFEKVRNFGLRHRAALGLSERSDALTVVVSEESGIIRIAQNGKLWRIDDEDDLRTRLENFYREKFPRLNLANLFKWMTKNIFLLALSFMMAWGVFSLVNSKFAYVQRNFLVTPEFVNIPEDVVINSIVPQGITVTLRARGSDFEVFKPESLRLSVDIGSIPTIAKAGKHRVAIDVKNVSTPFKFSVVKIDPLSIEIKTVKPPQPTPTPTPAPQK